MNRKTLLYLALGLMIAGFVFMLISFAPGVNLAMTILAIVFSAAAIICMLIGLSGGSKN